MSDDLYRTRLRWDGRRGTAKHCGVVVELQESPAIGVADLTEIEYAPEVRVHTLRIGCGPMQEMNAEQIAAVEKFLVRMASDARDAVEGKSTLVVVIQAAKTAEGA